MVEQIRYAVVTCRRTAARLIRPGGYVTLDRATTRSAAAADPDGFVADLPVPAAIDEVQRVPDLLLVLKAAVDEDRRPGRFLVTGSANVLMLPAVADATRSDADYRAVAADPG